MLIRAKALNVGNRGDRMMSKVVGLQMYAPTQGRASAAGSYDAAMTGVIEMSSDPSSLAVPSDEGLTGATPCATNVDLYLHPLLDEPPVRSTTDRQTWQEYEQLVSRTRLACSSCPILPDCLYKAVAQTDVSGYVGCTTPNERNEIRKLLHVTIETEDFDSFAGARGTRQPVDHEDVLRMRSQHPDDPLEQIASRLGCSLSTVKRHLRRARDSSKQGSDSGSALGRPTMDEVFDAFEQVVEPSRSRPQVS